MKLRNKEQVIKYLHERQVRQAQSGEIAYRVADKLMSIAGVYPDGMEIDGEGFVWLGFRFRFNTSPFVPDDTVVTSVTRPGTRDVWTWYIGSPDDLLRLLETQTPYQDWHDWRDRAKSANPGRESPYAELRDLDATGPMDRVEPWIDVPTPADTFVLTDAAGPNPTTRRRRLDPNKPRRRRMDR